MRRVYIFGAGASACYDNGYSTERPPLQSNFWDLAFGSEATATMQVRRGSLYSYLDDAGLYDSDGRLSMTVEEVMTKVHEDTLAAFSSAAGAGDVWRPGRRMPITPMYLAKVYQDLVLLCAQTVNNLSVGRPCRNYMAVVANLNPEDTLITFNWDTLLDRALWESGTWQPDSGYAIDFGYILDETWQRTPRDVPASKHELLKLHGSTNWLIPYVAFDFRDGTRKMLFLPETEAAPVCYFRCTTGLPSYQDLFTPSGPFNYGFPPNHPEFEASGYLYPMIVPPSRVKYYDDLPDVLPRVWARARERISAANEVIVIGYSFPETDEMSWDLMKALARRKTVRVKVVGPHPDSVVNRLKMRLHRDVDAQPMGFTEFAATLS